MPVIVWDLSFETDLSTNEEHMGSTTFGNVNPAMTGLAVPQNIKINRAGFRRVREMVAAR